MDFKISFPDKTMLVEIQESFAGSGENTGKKFYKRVEDFFGSPVYISVPDWAKNLTPPIFDSKYAYKIAKKVPENYLNITSIGENSQRTKVMIKADAPDPRQRNIEGAVRRGKPTMAR